MSQVTYIAIFGARKEAAIGEHGREHVGVDRAELATRNATAPAPALAVSAV